MKTTSLISILTLLYASNLVAAAETIRPKIGRPLRDASVCAGADGNYYLTGTIATALPEGKPDFNNSQGTHVWKSKDLQTWEDLGLVWDIWTNPTKANAANCAVWQRELYPVPGLPAGERARGMTAPKLAYDGERFWITFSMNGYAVGALPGTTDIKGPYKDTLLIAEAGGAPTDKSDASLFIDTDGTRYLVWGGGSIAKLKSIEMLEKLGAGDVGFENPVTFLPATAEGFTSAEGLPERGAPYGPVVFHDGKHYQFLFTAATLRDGGIHEDSYICHADQLLGPYSKPQFLILDSGRVSAFKGPDGKVRLAYSNTQQEPVIAAFPTAPVNAVKAGVSQPGPAKIATHVPPREISEKPADIPQLLEFIEPCMDQPLRDAALCQGPDKTWYMIGTEAAQSEMALDFSHNNGVRLWKSTDRVKWTDCGYVWDIDRDAPKSPQSAWQLEGHLDLTCGAKPKIGRAMTAPEIHYLKNTFWIVYSMNGSGIGLLKSSSGKAEGPYVDMGKIVANGRDGSLFADGETIYLVWGQGFVAPMKDDMTGIAAPAKTLFTQVQWYPRQMRRAELMGLWGSHLVKQDNWYIWTFTTRTGRNGINAIDTMASWSKSLDGPWGEPCLMLPNGGQSTLVADGVGGWIATVSGEDEYSNCPLQPALTAVVSGPGNGGNPKLGKLNLPSYRPNASVSEWKSVISFKSTALDLWIGFPDLIRTKARDVFVQWDGKHYYLTGSFVPFIDEVVVYRSSDLLHWEEIRTGYRFPNLKEDGFIKEKDLPAFDALLAGKTRPGIPSVQIGENKFYKWGERYYILFMNLGNWPMVLLESQGADPKGPYKPIRQVPFGDLWEDHDGALFIVTPGPTLRRYDSVQEFLKSLPSTQNLGAVPIELKGIPGVALMEDCETGLERMGDKYVYWSTDWSGSYDGNYIFADSYKGPWKGKFRIVPHAGNGNLFKDKDGHWWWSYFMNTNAWDSRSQSWCRANFYPLDVLEEDGELIIEPKALRVNRARLEKMGVLWQSPRTPTQSKKID